MPKYWVKYEKGENAKYISHLDFVRTMNRTFRRGRVPIAYSQGFNPHPLLSFGLPLPVGVTSECEFLELELAQDIDPQELLRLLNAAAPEGLSFLDADRLTNKNTLKGITWALYRITLEAPPTAAQLQAFLSKQEVIVDKRTKSGTKPTDIRHMIRSLETDGEAVTAMIAAGSVANLKPETLLVAMEQYIPGFQAGTPKSHRLKLYNEQEKELPYHEPTL